MIPGDCLISIRQDIRVFLQGQQINAFTRLTIGNFKFQICSTCLNYSFRIFIKFISFGIRLNRKIGYFPFWSIIHICTKSDFDRPDIAGGFIIKDFLSFVIFIYIKICNRHRIAYFDESFSDAIIVVGIVGFWFIPARNCNGISSDGFPGK